MLDSESYLENCSNLSVLQHDRHTKEDLTNDNSYRKMTEITKVTEGTAFMMAEVNDAEVYFIPK